ncbi:hypothetical protein, partial [Acinetobacter johnsonii]|uniref:hypothetical protein n=1 Tax=Acinetobacter johnsonii TaxID=40214 RepID=UPI001F33F85C
MENCNDGGQGNGGSLGERFASLILSRGLSANSWTYFPCGSNICLARGNVSVETLGQTASVQHFGEGRLQSDHLVVVRNGVV